MARPTTKATTPRASSIFGEKGDKERTQSGAEQYARVVEKIVRLMRCKFRRRLLLRRGNRVVMTRRRWVDQKGLQLDASVANGDRRLDGEVAEKSWSGGRNVAVGVLAGRNRWIPTS